MKRFDGKNAVVIGAAAGQIGGGIAERLADEGAHVRIGDLNVAGARALAEKIVASGGVASAGEIDVRHEASVADFFAQARSDLGGIHCLASNAAYLAATQSDRDVLAIEMETFDELMAVNLRGHVLCCRHVIPDMLTRNAGAIVLTGSINAARGEPTRISYACAKAGVAALARHIGARWGKRGIRANTVSPGKIVTANAAIVTDAERDRLANDRFLQDIANTRLGAPSDIGGAVAFLLSDDAAFVNAEDLTVDGGFTLVMNPAPSADDEMTIRYPFRVE